MKEIFELFSKRVKMHCSINGITQDELAKITKINPEIITAIFNEQHDADLVEIEKIANALKVKAYELLIPY